jgi:integrase
MPRGGLSLSGSCAEFRCVLRTSTRFGSALTCSSQGGNPTSSPSDSLEAETKNRIDLEFYVGPRLHALLRTYIDYFLPFFAADSTDFDENHWLFPSGGNRRGPLSIGRLRKIITRTVAEYVGATVHPHLFRALTVTLALEHSPDALDHCRRLLGDKSLTIVLRHYNMMREMDAARRQSAFVDAEEDRLQGLMPSSGRGSGRSS